MQIFSSKKVVTPHKTEKIELRHAGAISPKIVESFY